MCDYLKNQDLDSPIGDLSDEKLGHDAIVAACSEDEQSVMDLRKNLSEISLGKE